MRTIVDYTIASGNTRELEERVKRMISEGWQPLGGGFSISYPASPAVFPAQAMVRYEDSSDAKLPTDDTERAQS